MNLTVDCPMADYEIQSLKKRNLLVRHKSVSSYILIEYWFHLCHLLCYLRLDVQMDGEQLRHGVMSPAPKLHIKIF